MKKETVDFINKLNESNNSSKIMITSNKMKEIPVKKGSITATPSIEKEMKSKKSLKEGDAVDYEDKLKELYQSYRADGMEDSFWSDLLNCIDNVEYLDQWYASLEEGCSNTLKEYEKEIKSKKSLKEALIPVSELPDMCYGVLPTDCSIIIIKKGENGYYLTNKGYEREYADIEDWNEKNNKADEVCNRLNAQMDITPEQRQSMEVRSMFGNWSDLEESQKLEEKRNPENDEANELIRNSLSNDEYAKNHATDLRKHGIKYIPPKEDWQSGALEGKEGRRLNITNRDWDKDDVRRVTDNYGSSYGKGDAYSDNYKYDDSSKDRNDLYQKTYSKSKQNVQKAKNNIKKQATKVANLEKKDKEVGVDYNPKTHEARKQLNAYKELIKNGVRPDYKDTDKIHPDTDLKGFLNAKKHSDRELPREKDPKYQRHGGKIADPSNKDVEDYKEVKSGREYLAREKERNKQYDDEDQERIRDMKQRAKEDKQRRDSYVNREEKEVNKIDKRINNKLNAFRKRMNRQ